MCQLLMGQEPHNLKPVSVRFWLGDTTAMSASYLLPTGYRCCTQVTLLYSVTAVINVVVRSTLQTHPSAAKT